MAAKKQYSNLRSSTFWISRMEAPGVALDLGAVIFDAFASGSRQERYEAESLVGDALDSPGAATEVFIELSGNKQPEALALQTRTLLGLYCALSEAISLRAGAPDLLLQKNPGYGMYSSASSEVVDARVWMIRTLAKLSRLEGDACLPTYEKGHAFTLLKSYILDPQDIAFPPPESLPPNASDDARRAHALNKAACLRSNVAFFASVTALKWCQNPTILPTVLALSILRGCVIDRVWTCETDAQMLAVYREDQIMDCLPDTAWNCVFILAASSSDRENNVAKMLIKAAFDHSLHPLAACSVASLNGPAAQDVCLLPLSFTRAMCKAFPYGHTDVFLDIVDASLSRDEKGVGAWTMYEIPYHDHAITILFGAYRNRTGLSRVEASALNTRVAGLLSRYLLRLAANSRADTPFDILRSFVLTALGRLAPECKNREAHIAQVAIEQQLGDGNAEIVRAAAETLGKLIGWPETIKSLLATAGQSSGEENLRRIGNAMRYVADESGKNKVTEVIQETLTASTGNQRLQNAARSLLVELGGGKAMTLLATRTSIGEKYTDQAKLAGEKVQSMFNDSLHDARRGFLTALAMDIILFLVGVGLVLVSAITAVLHDSAAGSGGFSWAGTAISGGAGLMAVSYTAFVQQPRAQVKAATDHMMYIKVVFLGFLRELGQVDQAFTRRLMEDDSIDATELKTFGTACEAVTAAAVARMAEMVRSTDAGLAAITTRVGSSPPPVGPAQILPAGSPAPPALRPALRELLLAATDAYAAILEPGEQAGPEMPRLAAAVRALGGLGFPAAVTAGDDAVLAVVTRS